MLACEKEIDDFISDQKAKKPVLGQFPGDEHTSKYQKASDIFILTGGLTPDDISYEEPRKWLSRNTDKLQDFLIWYVDNAK